MPRSKDFLTECYGSEDLIQYVMDPKISLTTNLYTKAVPKKKYNHKIVEENIKHKTIKMSTQDWYGDYYSYTAPNVSKMFV